MDDDELLRRARRAGYAPRLGTQYRAVVLASLGIVMLASVAALVVCSRSRSVYAWAIGPILIKYIVNGTAVFGKMARLRGRVEFVRNGPLFICTVAACAGSWLGWLGAPPQAVLVLPVYYAAQAAVDMGMQRAALRDAGVQPMALLGRVFTVCIVCHAAAYLTGLTGRLWLR